MKSDLIYLRHILKSIEKIESFLRDTKASQFQKNQMQISAVSRELEIIGEAGSRVSPVFRKKYSNIPWSEMKATRNFIIHQYFAVDAQQVWKTVRGDLPELKKSVEGVLRKSSAGE